VKGENAPRAEERTMKYMVLIYETAGTREAFMGEEGRALMATIEEVMAEITASGELIGTGALADPDQTRSVRLREGAHVTTDGPYAEAKEHLGGYLLLECETLERATEIAARWPLLPSGAIELRPLMGGSGDAG
jgi:hypothetical protein